MTLPAPEIKRVTQTALPDMPLGSHIAEQHLGRRIRQIA